MTTCYDLNTPFSRAELKRVKAVKFTMFDAATVQGFSVCEIYDVNVYANGNPIRGGINDPRMGPIDPRGRCESCGQDLKACPGHWGHITLARP
ncbi:unnamed protein product, partial [Polarella glacialis]